MVKSFRYLAIILISQCSSPKDIPLPESGKTLIFGHGGSGFGIINTPYVANSMESIRSAIMFHGADGIELDIQFTRDHEILVYHDADLSTQTTCSGCVQTLSYDEIKECFYRRGLLPTREEAPVLLDHVFEYFKEQDSLPWFSLNIQLRHGCLDFDAWDSSDLAFAARLAILVNSTGRKDKILIESEHLYFLQMIQKNDPQLKLMWIAKITEEHLKMAVSANLNGFICDFQETSESQIRLLKANKLEIGLFNANIRSDIKAALKFYPDYLQTDQIILSRQMRTKLH